MNYWEAVLYLETSINYDRYIDKIMHLSINKIDGFCRLVYDLHEFVTVLKC
jgi:hypothetical protein